MAYASHALVFLFISQLAIATFTTALLCESCVGLCKSSCEKEINLSLYLHQISAGPNHNQEQIVVSSFANGFGTTGVNDWPLLDAPQPDGNIIARAKGLHIQANQAGHGWFSPFSMVFQEQDSRYNRSTLQVMGMIGPEATGEWAIVGGTGKLSMARGIIKYKFPQIVTSFENYRQLDIHAFYTPQAV
ncbi:hypothetical protein ACQJBY_067631 [Aegilops geniculata]